MNSKETTQKRKNENLLIQEIKHSLKSIKNLLNITLLLGSLGFFLAGISSYRSQNIIEVIDADQIIFFPQGITMLIYGCIGLILSLNQILILNFGIGEGYNEFNKQLNLFTIVRKNSYSETIKVSFSISDIVRNITLKVKK